MLIFRIVLHDTKRVDLKISLVKPRDEQHDILAWEPLIVRWISHLVSLIWIGLLPNTAAPQEVA